MADKISIYEIEKATNELDSTLSSSSWNDKVKKTYDNFVSQQKSLNYDINWLAETINKRNSDIKNVEVDSIRNKYETNYRRFMSLRN